MTAAALEQEDVTVTGLVLAAGAGRRFGRPKALVDGWLVARVAALEDGGCTSVVVVLGAAAQEARLLVPSSARTVVAGEWREGMGASLRAGLDAVRADGVSAVLVALVDTPGLTAAVVDRLLGAGSNGSGRDPAHVLAQAAYAGVPGHPVLLGRAHWDGVSQAARGDRGARDYLARREVVRVECGDVADGCDVDLPPSSDNRSRGDREPARQVAQRGPAGRPRGMGHDA